MIIYINELDHSEKEIDNLFNERSIHYTKFDNEYMAVCRNEIREAIDNFLLSHKIEISEDKFNDLEHENAIKLYGSSKTNEIFENLYENANNIVKESLRDLIK